MPTALTRCAPCRTRLQTSKRIRHASSSTARAVDQPVVFDDLEARPSAGEDRVVANVRCASTWRRSVSSSTEHPRRLASRVAARETRRDERTDAPAVESLPVVPRTLRSHDALHASPMVFRKAIKLTNLLGAAQDPMACSAPAALTNFNRGDCRAKLMSVQIDDVGEAIVERVADILLVVADVGSGHYGTRLHSDLPAEHPLSTLYEGINSMIASLGDAQRQSEINQRELEEKLATIEIQRAAIRELATPIIEVWEGILCLPVVGVLDTTRASEMTEALLGAIAEKKATCAIIDITGIQVMDTGTADHFLRMARAVRLLGSDCVLTGINPGIAQTIVHMGVDLSGVLTHRSLRNALQHFINSRVRTATLDS